MPTVSTQLSQRANIPDNFGAPNGTPIDNAETVLPDLFEKLNATRPVGSHGAPNVMFIFVEPYNLKQITRTWGLGPNGFGHAAVAYNFDGNTEVMNIVGSGNPAMVNFLPLPEYLFGVTKFQEGCEQGGIYNRSIRMVALWDVPREKIQAMSDYYHQVKQDSELQEGQRTAGFSMTAPLTNAVGSVSGSPVTYGNCAVYTSRGLRNAGLLRHASMWPKEVFRRIMKEGEKNPDNMRVISFPCVPHAKKMSEGVTPGNAGLVGLSLNPVKATYSNWKYWRLGDFADAVVSVPSNSIHAEVTITRQK